MADAPPLRRSLAGAPAPAALLDRRRRAGGATWAAWPARPVCRRRPWPARPACRRGPGPARPFVGGVLGAGLRARLDLGLGARLCFHLRLLVEKRRHPGQRRVPVDRLFVGRPGLDVVGEAFLGCAARQAGGLDVGVLQAGVGAARHDARRRRRELGAGLVRPKAVVRVLERPLAVAGDVRLVERVAPEDVVHPFGDGGQILRLARKVVGQRQHDRVVEDERVRAPGISLGARLERQPVTLLGDQRLEAVGGGLDGDPAVVDLLRRQEVRHQRQRDRPQRADVSPVERRRQAVAPLHDGHLLEVGRLLEERLVAILLGRDEELGGGPVELVAHVGVVVRPAADGGGAGVDGGVRRGRRPGLLGRGQAPGGERLVELFQDARALRGGRRQVQRRRGRRAARGSAADGVLVGARAERRPLLVVDLVVDHARLRLAVGNLHLRA